MFQRTKLTITQLVERLIKFFDYINSLIDTLHLASEYMGENSETEPSGSSANFLTKLKELLKWSITNTHELLIDSISTSNSLSSNNQHSLINLDKLIENMSTLVNKEGDAKLSKKYKFCLNQSKSLIKLLNDSDLLNKNNTTSSMLALSLSSADQDTSLNVNDLIRIPSKAEFAAYFLKKRAVFKFTESKDELKQYESEWVDTAASNSVSFLQEASFHLSSTNTLNSEDMDIKLDELIARYGSDFSAALIDDKDLLKQLALSFEQQHQLIQHQQQQSQTQDDFANGVNGADSMSRQADQVLHFENFFWPLKFDCL